MLKLIMCVKRRTHLTREEFDHYWRNHQYSIGD
ncbi:ethyl tert-butyl ether degradation EthD [Salmonella enterica subsp. arizonae]|nr:ethyl tert-butyl ether degradation EthD [Salmonella enterica subsp. arizonae]